MRIPSAWEPATTSPSLLQSKLTDSPKVRSVVFDVADTPAQSVFIPLLQLRWCGPEVQSNNNTTGYKNRAEMA